MNQMNIADSKLQQKRNMILKASIFATGLSGIVAEYVISTLASYLIGNSVLQWTMTLSLMMFAMGVGSRISRYFSKNLLDLFVAVEFTLSLVCAASALLSYSLSVYLPSPAIIIYPIAFLIGLLIGLEIPIATRLNDVFEELRINISAVMEKDYYGSLLGGVLFAFVALPYLGLTYTPILLGSVNFIVAAVLFTQFRKLLNYRRILLVSVFVVPLILGLMAFLAEPIVLFGEQQKYKDRIIYEEQTPYQRIVVTEWKNYHWLYLNGNEQFSSYDEEKYHEPLVHPAMQLSVSRDKVLVLGGGDGLAVREILKYPEVEKINLVDIDPAMTELGKNYAVFQQLNQNSMRSEKVHIFNQDANRFLAEDNTLYGVIIIDLPDPKSVDIARLYTRQFYQRVKKHLAKGGVVITQAASPFFSKRAFLCILKTMHSAGLSVLPMHNHIPTLGEWGWVIGMNSSRIAPSQIKQKLLSFSFEQQQTRFINREAMLMMLSFGKNDLISSEEIKINDELDLKLYEYYRNGSWDLY